MRQHLDHARPAWRLALVAALLVVVPSCSGPRGGVSTDTVRHDVSSCAAVLPVARASVHGRARLLHVLPVTRRKATQLLGLRTLDVGSGQTATGRLCLVAYRGPFTQRDIHGVRQLRGTYALLVLTVRHPRVVGATLLNRLPHLD